MTIEGIEFIDARTGRQMMLIQSGSWGGWLAYKHPDGQWVTLRLATNEDREAIAKCKEGK